MVNGFGFEPVGISFFGIAQGLCFAGLALILILTIRRWVLNNNAPEITIQATLKRKYTKLVQHQQPVGGDPSGTHGFTVSVTEDCYAVFITENAEELKFAVSGKIFRDLTEGQNGKLIYKGTRFLDFK